MNSIWMIFIVDHDRDFPNFFPIAAYSSQEKALNKLESLPKNHNYQLFEIPIDDFFGVITNNREICSGMGNLYHEHFHYLDGDS
ncbi:hypothetical protein [Parageobacillus thermoglucosidasius]|uniref:hypothetical protein n=1 Tax=Parageobacillus thermoglucosidasius TaxID=1426 RepID=UPI000B576A9D|nr:hypothetical protein [Parageobacillus thermoglucosidasius]MBY6270244.1 hypothetical protein [Parageobacillus thermoglucosidasius]OUM91261.1 MAG: hypothetical protein BAA00_16295 [Parageobacillus thermoglucosidasius]